MSNFIDKAEKQLELFISVHGRKPINGTEFANWCEFVENNSQTISKPEIIVHLKEIS